LISFFITSLCKVQTVNFEKLAGSFDTKAKSSSSLRRIQRFIAGFDLNPDLIAKLIFSLLPEQKKLQLTIDRTNWKFGSFDINIFMLGIVYQGVAFPLLFTMLSKRGNSNSLERINLIKRFIRLFGREVIDSLVADREFVGEQWLEYLNQEQIKYYIRIRNNFKVFVPDKNQSLKVSWLFNSLVPHKFIYYPNIVKINNQLCYLSGCKLSKNQSKQDYLILVSFNKPENAQDTYKQRWQIEMCFKAMKSSGFNIEHTHLQNQERIQSLLLLVLIAFVWCYKIGIQRNILRPIKIKTHNRKAISIFKYGLNYVSSVFLNIQFEDDIGILDFLSCT